MIYTYVNNSDTEVITVLHEGRLLTAQNTHPKFAEIKALVNDPNASSQTVADLFSAAEAVARRFEKLSDQVWVKAGKIYFDHEVVDNSLTKEILRRLEKDEPFLPLVKFFEKLATNPSANSKDQLYRWIDNNHLVITNGGDIIFYKGVYSIEGGYRSGSSGTAISDGKQYSGYIPQKEGSIVEMPRSAVADNPNSACSTGLHVANWHHASRYGNKILKVLVNPRDVVSVPHDSNSEKVRVCRYRVVKAVTEPVGQE